MKLILKTMAFFCFLPLCSVGSAGDSTPPDEHLSMFLATFAEIKMGDQEGKLCEISEIAATLPDCITFSALSTSPSYSKLNESEMGLLLIAESLSDAENIRTLPIFEVSSNIREELDPSLQEGRNLSYHQLESFLFEIKNINSQNSSWGKYTEVETHDAQQLLNAFYRIKSLTQSFAVPNQTTLETHQERILNWIASQQSGLYAYLDYLAGEIEASPEILSIHSAITTLENYHQNNQLLCFFSPESSITGANVVSSPYLTLPQVLLESINQYFISPQIIDWAIMLDSINQKEWDTAFTRAEIIKQYDTSISCNDNSSHNQTTLSLSFFIFWISIFASIFLIFAQMNGVGLAYWYSTATLSIPIIFQPLVPNFYRPEFFQAINTQLFPILTTCLWWTAILVGSRTDKYRGHHWLKSSLLIILLTLNLGTLELTPTIGNTADAGNWIAVTIILCCLLVTSVVILANMSPPLKGMKQIDSKRVIRDEIYRLQLLILLLTSIALGLTSTFKVGLTLHTIILIALILTLQVRYFSYRWTNLLNKQQSFFQFGCQLIGYLVLLLTLTLKPQSGNLQIPGYTWAFLYLLLAILSVPGFIPIKLKRFFRFFERP